MGWKLRVVCKHILLLGFNRTKLKAERKVLVDPLVITEQLLDVVVVIQAARLKSRTQKIINPSCHLVLDLMA